MREAPAGSAAHTGDVVAGARGRWSGGGGWGRKADPRLQGGKSLSETLRASVGWLSAQTTAKWLTWALPRPEQLGGPKTSAHR